MPIKSSHSKDLLKHSFGLGSSTIYNYNENRLERNRQKHRHYEKKVARYRPIKKIMYCAFCIILMTAVMRHAFCMHVNYVGELMYCS